MLLHHRELDDHDTRPPPHSTAHEAVDEEHSAAGIAAGRDEPHAGLSLDRRHHHVDQPDRPAARPPEELHRQVALEAFGVELS
ncbi:MAG TPA: hypothetical protein VK506_11945 [Conexibacter sp.]|nr:hypothetical protein [Conexibacter sp.]